MTCCFVSKELLDLCMLLCPKSKKAVVACCFHKQRLRLRCSLPKLTSVFRCSLPMLSGLFYVVFPTSKRYKGSPSSLKYTASPALLFLPKDEKYNSMLFLPNPSEMQDMFFLPKVTSKQLYALPSRIGGDKYNVLSVQRETSIKFHHVLFSKSQTNAVMFLGANRSAFTYMSLPFENSRKLTQCPIMSVLPKGVGRAPMALPTRPKPKYAARMD
jgi:hypothetical protein